MNKQRVLTLDEARAALVEAQTSYNKAAAPLAATIERRQRIVDALSDPDTDPDELDVLKRDALRLSIEADAATGQLKALSAKLASALTVYLSAAHAATSARLKELDTERRAARADIDAARRRQTSAANKITAVAMQSGRLDNLAEIVQRQPDRAVALIDNALAFTTGL